MNTTNAQAKIENHNIQAQTNSLSDIFEVEIEGHKLSVSISLITPDDKTAFTSGKDGLTDDERHNFERYKTSLYFAATIVEHNDLPCIIEISGAFTARNRMKSTKQKDLEMMLSLSGVALLDRPHVQRKLLNAIDDGTTDLESYFDDLDSVKY